MVERALKKIVEMTVLSPCRNPEVIAAIGNLGYVEIQSTFHHLEKGDEFYYFESVALSEGKP